MDYLAHTPDQLSKLLKSHRCNQHLTQAKAGAKVGLKQSTVSIIEDDAGRTGVDTLYKLLSALNLELVIRDKAPDTAKPSGNSW